MSLDALDGGGLDHSRLGGFALFTVRGYQDGLFWVGGDGLVFASVVCVLAINLTHYHCLCVDMAILVSRLGGGGLVFRVAAGEFTGSSSQVARRVSGDNLHTRVSLSVALVVGGNPGSGSGGEVWLA